MGSSRLAPPAALDLHLEALRARLSSEPDELLYPYRRVDPAECIVDPVEAERRLGSAAHRLAASEPRELPSWPVAEGDRQALLARVAHYAVLGVGRHMSAMLATTPVPRDWIASALDHVHRVALSEHPGIDDNNGWQLWAVLAAAADSLAGTGELPGPSRVWRFVHPRGPYAWLPTLRGRQARRYADQQEDLLHRSSWWLAAECTAGGSHDSGGLPVERYVQPWDLPQLVGALTRTDWSEHNFPWSTVDRASQRTRTALDSWQFTHRDLLKEALAIARRAGIPLPRFSSSRAGWLNPPDLVRRCRWRSILLAGSFGELSQQLERRLMRDMLDRYITRRRRTEQTCLRAMRLWTRSVRTSNWHEPGWVRRSSAEHERIALLVLLGYGPGDVRRDPALRSAGPDDLRCMVALSNDNIIGFERR